MRWVDGFVERHGDTTADVGAEAVLLQAADTATVRLEVPWPPFSPPPTRDPSFVAGVLARHALRPRTVGLLLVRRGGFALGTARDGEPARAQDRHPLRAVAHRGRWLVAAALRPPPRQPGRRAGRGGGRRRGPAPRRARARRTRARRRRLARRRGARRPQAARAGRPAPRPAARRRRPPPRRAHRGRHPHPRRPDPLTQP
nr:hypothetical protein [Angustibacter aerolatus]